MKSLSLVARRSVNTADARHRAARSANVLVGQENTGVCTSITCPALSFSFLFTGVLAGSLLLERGGFLKLLCGSFFSIFGGPSFDHPEFMMLKKTLSWSSVAVLELKVRLSLSLMNDVSPTDLAESS